MSLLLAATPAWAQTGPDAEPDTDADQGPSDPADAMGGLDQGPDEPGASASGDRPWAAGVSPEDQAAAFKVFAEGNALLRDSLFVAAAAKYREALAHWEHPAIHYNLALALLNLDQPLEVYEALEKAMRFGPEPLDTDKFDRARSYRQIVERQLARVVVLCDETEARVTMDGKELFVGPGRYEGLARVGEHSFIATKPGYIPANETHVLLAAEVKEIRIDLYTPEEVTVRKRRWSEWKPWAVVGAGVAAGLVGGGLHLLSEKNFNDFDAMVERDCKNGCPNLPTDQVDRARLQRNVAIASYATGGAVLATGFVLVYLNRIKLERIDVTAASERQISLIPMISPGAAGVTTRFRF